MSYVAVELLGKIGDARVVEPLIGVLKDEEWFVRMNAAEVLGKIGDARAVEPLIGVLKDANEHVRREAAEALGEIKDARVVEPLVAALKDAYAGVRWAAEKGLASLNWQPADDIQRALRAIACKNWNEAVGLGSAAVEPLIGVLKDRSTGQGATTAIWKILERAAGDVTTKALHSLSRLDGVVEMVTHYGDGACGHPSSWEQAVPVDCSHVRQLARQELIRRGIQA